MRLHGARARGRSRGARQRTDPRAGRRTETFGVISDLDDTVIQSRITSFLQAVRTVMLGNARTRLPFPGVAAFYQALERGGDGARTNPIFYVSSSPWNIHDVIADFMDIQRIPVGPIHLRDWDVGLNALSSHRLKRHKEPIIREILDLYPTLPFILIGDDSQKDPEIYRAIIDAYPGPHHGHLHPQRARGSRALGERAGAGEGGARRRIDAHPRRRHLRRGEPRGGAGVDREGVARPPCTRRSVRTRA